MTEKDWKLFKELRLLAMDRYCARVLQETAAVCQRKDKSNHEIYLSMWKMLKDRDWNLGNGFNDLRRSTADMQLAIIYRLGVIKDEELEGFSEQARATLRSFLS